MKQLLTVLLTISCFALANAQGRPIRANSSTPSGLAPEVKADADIKLTLYNAIEISPSSNWTYGAVFMTAADYNGTTNAGDMGSNTWYVSSTRSFDLSLQFTDLKSDPNVKTIMPVNKLSYSTNAGTNWNTAARSVPSVASFGAGKDIEFTLNLKVNPGWNFPGGFYSGRVFVTATQH